MKKTKNKNELLVFLISFIFLLILGVSLTYNFNFESNYNLLFDSDTARVIGDMINPLGDHNRLDVHPLFVLIMQPLCLILKSIVQNKALALVIISSLASATSVLFIYKIMKEVSKDEKLNIVMAIIYCLSFSNIIFTSGIETYNFASLFLIILFYFFIKNLKEKSLDKYKMIILILLGLMTLSFTLTNFMIYLIVLFALFIFKKINIKKGIILVIVPLTLLVGLSYFQKLVWQNTPTILHTNVRAEKNNFSKTTIDKNNIINVLENDYMNSLLSTNTELKIDYGIKYNGLNYRITFKDISIINKLILGMFYLLLIVLIIHNFKNNLKINVGLLLALSFNTLLHIIYGNDGTFLYSMHFLYLIILLFGINLSTEENKYIKKVSHIILLLLILFEIILNTKTFIKVLLISKDVLNTNYLVSNLGLPITILIETLLIFFILFLVIYLIKTIKQSKNEKNRDIKTIKLIKGLCIIFLIVLTFISLESTTPNRFLFIPLKGNAKEITPKTKIDYLDTDFKKHFEKEIKSLETYQNEYTEFKNKYKGAETSSLNWSDYYYFGLGNRRKIYYKESALIDLETNEVILNFTEKEHLVIPNIYTVIVETKENDFLKIYEDNNGVHIEKNGKDEIIENTETYTELYAFENQKYQNIKKVLYGEILFNIKDSMITPNIIVYKEPWYRDAAITSMVLKQTNNTNLIKDWVQSITEIYDKQNNGVEEADNLGELLYILSTQEERNVDLINRIEEEAERIATTNPKGYYIYGKTDFGDMHLYQNLWYKLGIEAVEREFKFDLDSIEEDSYSSTAWWSDYEVKEKHFQEVDYDYPYLTIAAYHKLGTGLPTWNSNIYPLSWEANAGYAKYENYAPFDNRFNNLKTSPLHSWTASEMLLFILDETNNLDFK